MWKFSVIQDFKQEQFENCCIDQEWPATSRIPVAI